MAGCRMIQDGVEASSTDAQGKKSSRPSKFAPSTSSPVWRRERQCVRSIGWQKLEHADHELGRSKNGPTAGRFAANILDGQQGFGASIARPTLQDRGQVRQPLQQQRAMRLQLLIAGTLADPVSSR